MVKSGSRVYAEKLVEPIRHRIRTNAPVRLVRRHVDRVDIVAGDRAVESFDSVVVATHSDQALDLLSDASPAERDILEAIPYQENVTVLHTDPRVMPKRKLAWAAWNYHLGVDGRGVAVTYWMNELQSIPGPTNWFVTLNDVAAIDPAKILKRITYHHPIYRRAGITAQERWADIQDVRRTGYCGAYWSHGFHEDGVNSALRVAECFGLSLDDLEREMTRAASDVRPREVLAR